MSDNYIYQKFLTLTDTSSVRLEDYKSASEDIYFLPDYTVSKELFDEKDLLKRTVRISKLDESIDSENDFYEFCSHLKNISTLILIDDRQKCPNLIHGAYSIEITKAYILWFQKVVKEVYVCKM